MNTLGITLIWCVAQVTAASLAGSAVYLIARRAGQGAGRLAAVASLTVVLVLTVATFSPWPSWLETSNAPSTNYDEGPAITIDLLSISAKHVDRSRERPVVGVSPPKLSVTCDPQGYAASWAGWAG